MNISEISKPVTAASLNESLAKKFGQRLNLESYTLEKLEDVRNKMRTKIFNVETNESFDSVQNEAYQKSKLFLDVLNAEIAEREERNVSEAKAGYCSDDCCGADVKAEDCTCAPTCKHCDCNSVKESAKPDFLDMDKDGDKKEPMKKAIKDKKKKVKEGKEDEAELVMAAKDMVDRVTGWMEDTAEMQTESMLELADAIRDEHGQEKADQFSTSVKPSLEGMYEAMEACRGTLTAGVQILTGEGAGMDMMGADPALDDPAMEPTTDADTAGGDLDLALDADDEFGAAKAAIGGEAEAGREKRESATPKGKRIKEAAGKMPSKAEVMKCCKDGMSKADCCKKFPDCDHTKLKEMYESCMSEMKESKIIRKRAVLERSRKLGTILSKKK